MGTGHNDSRPLPTAVLETATRRAGSVAHGVGSGLKAAARAAGTALQSLGETAESIEAREKAERLQEEAIQTLAEVNARLQQLTGEPAKDATPKRAPRSKTTASRAKNGASPDPKTRARA
jgi:hypothetical protein